MSLELGPGSRKGDADVVKTSSGLQKPKKVWAEKKFVDTKADKAK